MEDLTEQEALRIIDAYGEPFLRYVLALPDDKPIAEALLSINIELMLILSSAIDPSSYASGGTIDPTFLASLNFSSYRADLGSSLANSLRLLAGGNLPIVPDGEDPVVQAIREITSDIWPSLLLKHPKHTPRAFWLGASTSVFLHPRSLDACKAFMADDRLASLFPDTPSIDTARWRLSSKTLPSWFIWKDTRSTTPTL